MSFSNIPASLRRLALTGLCLTGPCLAQAGEVYANLGLPGVGLGYAQPLNSRFTLRADVSTLGQHRKTANESGIDYQVTAKLNRAGLFADWFLWGGLRLTGGMTLNDMRADLNARGNGQPMTVGSRTFITDSTDYFDVSIKFPRTTPYFGLGYGHQLNSGVGFVFDVGASFGRAKLTERHGGNNLGTASQADVDAELAQLRDGVGKITYLPQVSLGLAFRF